MGYHYALRGLKNKEKIGRFCEEYFFVIYFSTTIGDLGSKHIPVPPTTPNGMQINWNSGMASTSSRPALKPESTPLTVIKTMALLRGFAFDRSKSAMLYSTG